MWFCRSHCNTKCKVSKKTDLLGSCGICNNSFWSTRMTAAQLQKSYFVLWWDLIYKVCIEWIWCNFLPIFFINVFQIFQCWSQIIIPTRSEDKAGVTVTTEPPRLSVDNIIIIYRTRADIKGHGYGICTSTCQDCFYITLPR